MRELDCFLPHIRPYAPGVADPTAYFAIRQAAIEFCERTKLWRFDDEFQASGDECLLAPDCAVVHSIEAAFYEGQRLTPISPQQLDAQMPGWRAGSIEGRPEYITQLEPNTLMLVPKATAGTIRLALFLKPSEDADELPDFIADEYRRTVADGALFHILTIPNQSFSNPEMAMAFGAKFQAKLDTLASKGATGKQRARIRTRSMNF